MISFDDFVQQTGIPIYVQIVLYLKRAIAAGIVRDGDELPSRRVLSARLGVNPNTIQKAYRILEEEGLINSHAGAKSLVAFDQSKADQVRRELLEEDQEDAPEGPEEEALFAAYEQGLKDLGVTDFDGLLNRALAGKELPPKARRPFSHLLVDEFQDVNALQYELVLQWSREGSLFVIGDPDQSIYGFRGAVGDCFQRLGEDFPDLVTLRLARNYRSSPQVLGCALPVISQNPGGPHLPYRSTQLLF